MVRFVRCKKCGRLYPNLLRFCPYCHPDLFMEYLRKLGEDRYGLEDRGVED